MTNRLVNKAGQPQSAYQHGDDQPRRPVDPDTGNNSASITVTPQQADLAVTKRVSNATPNVGDTITFVVSVANKGPDPATNVQLTDPLPSGLTFVSATPSQGNYDSSTRLWTVGIVNPSAAQVLTITARVDSPDTQTNTAAISHSDQFDPDTSNNKASATETAQEADLFVTKIVNNPHPNVGDTVTFLITVGNNGPDAATEVQVNDLLPAGLSLVSADPSQGTYNIASGVWTVGTVAHGGTATLQLQATVGSPNQQTNTAEISHADQFDPDRSNNQASATVTPLAPPPPPPPPPPQTADVSLAKEVSQSNPIFGTPVTYTLIVHNNGPAAATDVVVTDTLPTGLIFLTATPNQGSFDAGSGRWAVGTLASGASATLQITGMVAGIGPITNSATATALEADPNLANNSSSVTIDGMLSASQVSKSMFLSSSDAPLNPQMLAAQEAMFAAVMQQWVNLWDALLSEVAVMLDAPNDPGNGGIPIFKGSLFGSPLVVYENPFAGQVTAVQFGTIDFLFENNAVASVRLL